ncbi:MAG: hypothetical protein ACXVBR_08330 [Flavisolibacter sp.]
MKYILSLLLLSSFCSCTSIMSGLSGRAYRYKFEMLKPKADTSLSFEDARMKFEFTIQPDEIDFIAKNKSEEPVRINWDEASIVLNGTAEKTMHKGVRYIDRNSSQPPTTIPANASIDDLVVPTKNVSYSSVTYSNGWETDPIFPKLDYNNEKTRLSIQHLKGNEFTLYLPVKDVNGKEFGYSFLFKITDVLCINCNGEKTNSSGRRLRQ